MNQKQVKNIDTDYDVIVVGGGASGLMAAGIAGESGLRVLVLEKNTVLGKKLSITGGGRCNITNDTRDPKQFLEKFPQAKKYLYSAFSQFAVDETFDFFEVLREFSLVTQARNRVFPQSESAPDVRDCLVTWCKDNGVVFKNKSPVKQISRKDTHWEARVSQSIYTTDKIIVSTGGYAAPETGSTGDGFSWLRDLGHTIADPSPSIVPLKTDSAWVHRLQGTSWDYLKLRFYVDSPSGQKQKINKTGKVLFTHFGISGPLVLNTSKEVSDLLHEGDVECSLDLYPDTDFNDLDKRITKLLDQAPKKTVFNTLSTLIPKTLLAELFELNSIDKEVASGNITKDQRKSLVRSVKDIRFPIVGTMGFDRAVIADGGVDPREIDFKTMESRVAPGLYIIGDLLNINRPSGGYGLQLCWTTGYVAGKNILK